MTPEATAAMQAASTVTGIPHAAITGKRRHAHVVVARFLAWHIMRDGGATLPKIAVQFDRDHTSIMNGLRRFDEWMGEDFSVREMRQNAWALYRAALLYQRLPTMPHFYRHGHFQEQAT